MFASKPYIWKQDLVNILFNGDIINQVKEGERDRERKRERERDRERKRNESLIERKINRKFIDHLVVVMIHIYAFQLTRYLKKFCISQLSREAFNLSRFGFINFFCYIHIG